MPQQPKRTYTKYNPSTDQLDYEFHYNDDETADLHRQINRNPQIAVDDLRRIALWKIDRVLSVSDETIEKLRHLAVKEDLLSRPVNSA